MKKVLYSVLASTMIVCSLISSAGACGSHHQAVAAQCSVSTCMVNGVCNGTCAGTGSCRSYSGCNHVQTYVQHHGHSGHHAH